MFTAKIIAFFFIGMFVGTYVMVFVLKQKMYEAAKILMLFNTIAGIYCVGAGIFLATGWSDPFASYTNEELAKSSFTHGSKNAALFLVIRFWPYVLIGYGGYVSYNNIQFLRKI